MEIEKLKDAKTKLDLLDFLKSFGTSPYREAAIKKVQKGSFNDALQATWDFALQQEGKYFLGKEKERNCWFKDTAIRGMEVHSK
jgi:hypothetical protein